MVPATGCDDPVRATVWALAKDDLVDRAGSPRISLSPVQLAIRRLQPPSKCLLAKRAPAVPQPAGTTRRKGHHRVTTVNG